MTASALDLTTIALVKKWIATTSANNDAQIQSFITEFSLWCLRNAGRGPIDGSVPLASPFNQPCDFNEFYDGSGTDRQFLRNWPILSIASCSIDGSAQTIVGAADTITCGLLIDASRKSIALRGGSRNPSRVSSVGFRANPWGGRFNQGVQNVNVAYSAGFPLVPVTNELQTIPLGSPYSLSVLAQTPWISDTSVHYFSSGNPLTRVFISPLAGQYFVVGGGVYLFNAVDAGAQLLMSYVSAGTPIDLQQMATRVVGLAIKRGAWIGQSSQSMAGGAGSISYTTKAMDDKDRSVLDYYRRSAIV